MVRATSSAHVILGLVLLASSAFAQGAANGVSWGFTRTYWDGTWYKDGYAGAGTGGNMVSVRREMPMNDKTWIAVVGSYSWLRHTTTTLTEPVVIDPLTDEVISGGALNTRTDNTFFREVELAALVHHYLDNEGHHKFYIGGGPSIRWGAAGKRTANSPNRDPNAADFLEWNPPHTYYHTQAAWFGLSALVGLKQQWKDDGATAFIEPRLLWSPDASDRYQRTFPPVNLMFAMGVLW